MYVTLKITKRNTSVWPVFLLKDVVWDKFIWTTVVPNVLKNETLQEIIFKYDASAEEIKNDKLMHLMDAQEYCVTSISAAP